MNVDCKSAIDKLKTRGESFDLIFMDPPYYENLFVSTLEKINDTKLLNKVMKGEIKFPHQLILLSVSDMKLEESDIKKYITQVDTELKSFNKFLWKFIK